MIYHLLPELEPFSAYRGGALSHTVANLMRLDPSRSVVCVDADDTWGFESERILVIARLELYSRIRARRLFPLWIASPVLRWVYEPLLATLKRGDIVWCHNRPLYAAALEKSVHAAGAKLICHFHDGLDVGPIRRVLRVFTPDACIFVSEYLREYWKRISPHLTNLFTIYNGADEELFRPQGRNVAAGNMVPIVLFVGRIDPQKGVHVLIEAMTILHTRGISATCRVIGSSFSGGSKATPYVTRLTDSAPSNIHFVGSRSAKEIAEEYCQADVLCCPSLWQEPFGKVNIEAMACGLPVVASRVGGIPEIASEGGVILVEPNSPGELADALQKLIEDTEFRAKTGAEGRQSFLRRFTWTGVLRQYQVVLDSVSRS